METIIGNNNIVLVQNLDTSFEIERVLSIGTTLVTNATNVNSFDDEDGLSGYISDLDAYLFPGLPNEGEPCIYLQIYKYGNDKVKCIQSHDRTIYPPEQTPNLFIFWRANSDTLDWIENEWVEVGWKRTYNGKQYEVIQAHMTLASWTPDVTPTLWTLIVTTSEWAYPVAYKVNDLVTYQNKTYKCLQAHTSQSGWKPNVVPALWQLIN